MWDCGMINLPKCMSSPLSSVVLVVGIDLVLVSDMADDDGNGDDDARDMENDDDPCRKQVMTGKIRQKRVWDIIGKTLVMYVLCCVGLINSLCESMVYDDIYTETIDTVMIHNRCDYGPLVYSVNLFWHVEKNHQSP